MYVFGGYTFDADGAFQDLNYVEALDLRKLTWTVVDTSGAPPPREVAAVQIASRRKAASASVRTSVAPLYQASSEARGRR
jgi:hypothetical protein